MGTGSRVMTIENNPEGTEAKAPRRVPMKRPVHAGLPLLVAVVVALLSASPASAQKKTLPTEQEARTVEQKSLPTEQGPLTAAEAAPTAALASPAGTLASFTSAPQTIAVPNQDTGGIELTLVGGALLGDSSVDQGTLAITGPATTQGIFGARLGSYGRLLGFEFGVEYSNGGLNWSAFDGLLTTEARAVYTDGNVVVSFLPGMVRPFVTGGVGVHYFALNDIAGEGEYKFGWNVGAGVRVVRGRFVFRGEVRDHVTRLDSNSFGLGLEEIIAIDESFTVHNVGLSAGIGVRF